MARRDRQTTLVNNRAAGHRQIADHRAKIVAKLPNLLVTIAWIFFECAIEDLLQALGNRVGPRDIERNRLFMQDRMTHIDGGLPFERPGARKHFVEQHAGRKNIRA